MRLILYVRIVLIKGKVELSKFQLIRSNMIILEIAIQFRPSAHLIRLTNGDKV